MNDELPHALDRRITIRARPETVFAYFTDSARFARWWGEGSRIDPKPGGEVYIRNPNGVVVTGKIVEIDPPARIVFTYVSGGVESLVTIRLEEADGGTELHLRHAFSSAKIRDHFVQGWRYQLAVFSKVLAEDAAEIVTRHVDAFLRAWGEPDGKRRRELLEACVTREISFRDAFSANEGLEDLLANLDAVQIFLPGAALSRSGDVRLSHGTALADWTATKDGGEPMGTGTNVFELAPDGRIARVTGFWGK